MSIVVYLNAASKEDNELVGRIDAFIGLKGTPFEGARSRSAVTRMLIARALLAVEKQYLGHRRASGPRSGSKASKGERSEKDVPGA